MRTGQMLTTWAISLGSRVRDAITGFSGTVTSRVEFITGCKQYCVTPSVDKEGKLRDGEYFDEDRLECATVTGSDSDTGDTGGPQRDLPPSG